MPVRKMWIGFLVVAALVTQVATAEAKLSLVGRKQARLQAELTAARKLQIQRLRAYANARQFPRNTYAMGKVNVLIDDDGNICAAANLMAQDGRLALVQRLAAKNNFLRFADVKSGAAYQWILHSGLTQEEIALIQEPYWEQPPSVSPEWQKQEDDRLHTHFMQTLETLEKNSDKSIALAVTRLMAA